MSNLKRHKDNTKYFEGLSFQEQSKSITVQILIIEKAIKANRKKALSEMREDPLAKRIVQLERAVERLKKFIH